MTEPIDQATKDLIKKEAEEYGYSHESERGYIAGATVWAERLKQERNKVIDEAIEVFTNLSVWTNPKWEDIIMELQKLKDKSHE